MNVQLFTLILLGMVPPLVAQGRNLGFRIRFTPCPRFTRGNDINETEFLGTWLENMRTGFFFEEGTKCVRNTYIPRDTGGFYMIYNRIATWPLPNEVSTRVRILPNIDESYKAQIKVRNTWISMGRYSVLYTDYDNIAVTYMCSNLYYGMSTEQAWILSRSATPLTSGEETTINDALAPTGIQVSDFQTVDNSCADK